MDRLDSSPDWIDHSRFQEALASAKARFSRIRKKYPDLRAYLVLSSPVGQTEADGGLMKMIQDLPDLLLNNRAKLETLKFIGELHLLEESKRTGKLEPGESTEFEQRRTRLNEGIQEIACNLAFDGNCRVEIRFHDLNYDLVWKLQADEWVDHDLTPRTQASIRIVLGTISRFGRPHDLSSSPSVQSISSSNPLPPPGNSTPDIPSPIVTGVPS